MFEIIILLLIAGITGGIGRSLVAFKRGGCIISIVVGFIGAYIGTILARDAVRDLTTNGEKHAGDTSVVRSKGE